MTVRSFSEFVGSTLGEWSDTGVLLPPYIETSQVVEGWETCGYLAQRFGDGAHIGNVMTLVDAGCIVDQLRSASWLSANGWGKNDRDRRTVADITVGQVESATLLLVVGDSPSRKAIQSVLRVLNPGAVQLGLDQVSDAGLRTLFSTSWRDAEICRSVTSARIVPPWLHLLQSGSEVSGTSAGLLYRRSCPFDTDRFEQWLANPPSSLVRGKGHVWLANQWDQSFGYSCAGSVHRVFAAGRWWASYGGAKWPVCDTARGRLLERWHPQFGDRGQEMAFVGLDLDMDQICSKLDSCLISEEEALELFSSSRFRSDALCGAGPH